MKKHRVLLSAILSFALLLPLAACSVNPISDESSEGSASPAFAVTSNSPVLDYQLEQLIKNGVPADDAAKYTLGEYNDFCSKLPIGVFTSTLLCSEYKLSEDAVGAMTEDEIIAYIDSYIDPRTARLYDCLYAAPDIRGKLDALGLPYKKLKTLLNASFDLDEVLEMSAEKIYWLFSRGQWDGE